MKELKVWLNNFWNSFPIQLVLLHFKKHQLILIYWAILFAVITGKFMHMFGAHSLFLAPEYLGNVNMGSTFFVGTAVGIFIMSWNITTFILFSRHFKFLATAQKPFLIYCLNNFIIPSCFVLLYIGKLYSFSVHNELFAIGKAIYLVLGLIVGITMLIVVSFIYFFTADKTINKSISKLYSDTVELFEPNVATTTVTSESNLIKVKTYLSTIRKVSLVREVKHYNKEFINNVFSRHHLAGLFLVFGAFFLLIISSFFLDNRYFQLPAASSIVVFFAILLAGFGALAYFLQNWSLPFAIVVITLLNVLFKLQIIDPTNKAYGLVYDKKSNRPSYDSTSINNLCTQECITADSINMIEILNNWKAKQKEVLPTMYIVNVSGGGSRSATFTMLTLSALDSILGHQLLQKTFMINGASGGMLGAAYYRALYQQEQNGIIKNKNDKTYVEDIGEDLLNPIFSSLVARDLISPIQKFAWQNQNYNKDRGYAFEQQLNTQTHGYLEKPIKDLAIEEKTANIPMIVYSSVVLRDGRKMLVSTQPISYMMKPANATTSTPDAIDFMAFFKQQNSENLNQLTALRMNASFPYVLPTVWLPSNPVVDVMDAGIRDNFGQELSLRFIAKFKTWLQKNVKQVVLVGIRDRPDANWDMPFEDNNITGFLAKPVGQLQYNIFKMQDYHQNEVLQFMQNDSSFKIKKVTFSYLPENVEKGASLSFHLTNSDKKSIQKSVWNEKNKKEFAEIRKME